MICVLQGVNKAIKLVLVFGTTGRDEFRICAVLYFFLLNKEKDVRLFLSLTFCGFILSIY